MDNQRKIAAPFALLPEGFVPGVVISVGSDGTVVKIEKEVEDIDSLPGTEYYSGVLIPGMVNTHSHIEYSYVKGMIPPGGGLPEFIRSIIAIKAANEVPDPQKAEAARVWDAKLYAEGVTAVGDHNNNDYVYDMKRSSRIYYHDFIELFDVDGQTAEETFLQGMERVERSRGYGFAATIIPHANYTMEDELMALTGGMKAASNGVKGTGRLSVHFKESVAMGGPEETDRVLRAISPERDGVLFVHCIYATEEDMRRAKERFGDKLFIAVCPLSNFYIENHMADLRMMKRLGIPITVGTDSLSSNTILSMAEEMKRLKKEYSEIPAAEVIGYATLNGARALGIDGWAGSLETGKRPGIVLLENFDFGKMDFREDTSARRIV